jgi:hypothetical protein
MSTASTNPLEVHLVKPGNQFSDDRSTPSIILLVQQNQLDNKLITALSIISFKPSSLHNSFLKWRQKEFSHPLIKKKRVAQLIYGKPGKNRYKLDHEGLQATP